MYCENRKLQSSEVCTEHGTSWKFSFIAQKDLLVHDEWEKQFVDP